MSSAGKMVCLLASLICSGTLFAQNDSAFSSKQIASFTLYDAVKSKSVQLPNALPAKHYSLFVFLSPECPLSQNYLPLLNELFQKYSGQVYFYGIIPGKAYSATEVSEFASKYGVEFPLLIDSAKSLTNYLRAAITPEIIYLDSESRLVYKGAIDDLLTALGKRKLKARNEYLKNAITQSLGNATVAVKRTKAVGCKINDY